MTKLNTKRQKTTNNFYFQAKSTKTSLAVILILNLNIMKIETSNFMKIFILNFHSKVVHFVMNYISQYYDNVTKEKEKYNNIESGDKWKVNSTLPILKSLKPNDCVTLLHMILRKIKLAETDNTISQFHVEYMSMSSSKQNKNFREKVERIFTPRSDTNTSQATKTIFKR